MTARLAARLEPSHRPRPRPPSPGWTRRPVDGAGIGAVGEEPATADRGGPSREQRIIPYLYVEDIAAYLEFLSRAFGFEKRMHAVDPKDSEHQHAEAALGGAIVMIGHASAWWGTASARSLPALHAGTYVYVDDVDAHCRRARAAGATIEAEPEDRAWGDRLYTARDPEGCQWYFATRKAGTAR